MKKRIITVLLAAALLASSMAGCGQGEETSSQQSSSASSPSSTASSGDTTTEAAYKGKDAENVNPKGVFPIVKEKITLELAVAPNAKVMDIETNQFTAYLEEKTGIDLIFNVLPSKDKTAKVKLMFASGDLSEVIVQSDLDNASILDYGSQALILPLNDLITDYGDEVFKMWEQAEDKNLKNLMTFADGNIYSMPKYSEQLINLYNFRAFVYGPWLDKLNMKAATTTDEYVELLKAFRDKDPNGNGKKDEIPLMSNTGHNPVTFYMNAFIFCDTQNKLLVENGKVDAAFIKPDFKQGLEWMNMLVKEGLLDPASFTQDAAQMKAIMAQPDVVVGSFPAGAKTNVLDVNSQLSKDYIAQPPLTGPNGICYSPATPPAVQHVYLITNKCKNPAAAYRLADFMLNDEVTFTSRFGFEGQDWKKAEADATGIGNVPATFELIQNVWGMSTQNIHWQWPNPGFMKYGTMEGMLWNNDPYEYNYYQIKYGVDHIQGKQPSESMPLDLVMTLEEMDEFAILQSAIKTYVDENITKFIVGDRSLDEWDAYLAEFDKMNLSKYLEIMQSAFDRTTGKK